MSENQYYIPNELSKIFKETTLPNSPNYETFKQWWNRGVDTILQDNSETQTKALTSGLSDLTVLKNDLQHRLEAKTKTIRQKREDLIKRIDECTEKPCPKLLNIWRQPSSVIHYTIDQSQKLLDDQLSELEAPLPDLEHIMFSVKRIRQVLNSAEKLYAKYLGIAQFLSYYWEYDLLSYFEDAKSYSPLVSWQGILNYSLKDLISLGQRDDHAARIRYMFYRDHENMTNREAYEAVEKELEKISESTYSLPDSVNSFNKTAKKHVNELRELQSR